MRDMARIHLAQHGCHGRTPVNTLLNFRAPWNAEKLLTVPAFQGQSSMESVDWNIHYP
jgi:hypothetical protein